MTEGIRTVAADRLVFSGERAAVERRHAEHFAARATPIFTSTTGALDAATLAKLERDRDNFDAVLERAVSTGYAEHGLVAAVTIDVLSSGGGLSRAQLRRLDAALALPAKGARRDVRARALVVRSNSRRGVGRTDDAAIDAREALRLALDSPSRRLLATVRTALGESCFAQGAMGDALEQFEQSLAIQRELGDRSAEAGALQRLGSIHQSIGDDALAVDYYERSLALALETSDGRAEARASMGLGSYHLEHGDFDGALIHYLHGRAITRRLGMARAERIVNGYLGVLHFDHDRIETAESFLHDAVRDSQAAGDVRVEGIFQSVLGGVFATLDRIDEARAALDSADQLLSSNTFFLELAKLYRAHLELAEARDAAMTGDVERASQLRRSASDRVVAARDPVPDPHNPEHVTRPFSERSDDARIALRILRRALARSRVTAGR